MLLQKTEKEKFATSENSDVNVSIKSGADMQEVDLTAVHSFSSLTDCKLQHFDDGFDCFAVQQSVYNDDEDNNVYDKIGANILIIVIEKLLQLGLTIQIFLTVYTLLLHKFTAFDKYVFHFSDWAINSPPILGVLANLVSFSLLLSQVGDIQKMFSGYFFQAVITTLIGGVFYIINLALKIIIHPRIEKLT